MQNLLQKFWPNSIKSKLIVGVAIVHAILMTIFVFDLVQREKKLLLGQVHQQSLALSKTISSNSIEWVISNNLSGLQEIIQSQLEYPNLSYAMIIDPNGLVLAHTNPNIIGQYLKDETSLQLLNASENQLTLFQSESLFDVASRIHLDNQTLAWSRVGLDTQTLQENLRYVTYEGVIYTFVAILIGSIFSWLLGVNLTRRIRKVINATKNVQPEKNEQLFLDISSDELGELMKNFNEMELKLHKQFKEIQTLAYTDTLTGLSNRELFEPKFNEALAFNLENKTSSALTFIDVDRFKQLNDAYGHDKGDLLLKEIANRIRSFIKEYDFAFRFGGDEFIIIFNHLAENISHEYFTKLLEKLLMVLNKPYDLAGLIYSSHFSVGVHFFNKNEHNIGEILKRADIALYHSKFMGQNNITLFKPEMETEIQQKMHIGNALKSALDNEELFWVIQPQVNMLSGEVIGGEVLLRWKHKDQFIPPNKFIPISEENQTIIPISNWLIESVFSCIQETKLNKLTISINLSPIHFFEKSLINDLKTLLIKYKVSPYKIKLEITEGIFLRDLEETMKILNQLKILGFQISLDDFGTGFSSLSYLKNLPIDQLKIDKTFIDGLPDNEKPSAIAKTIIDLTENLEINVIAEGVENEDQKQFLIQNNCIFCQGYLYSKPLSRDEFLAYVESSI